MYVYNNRSNSPWWKREDSSLCACACQSQHILARLNRLPRVSLHYKTTGDHILSLWCLLRVRADSAVVLWVHSRIPAGTDGGRGMREDTYRVPLGGGVCVSLPLPPVAQGGKHNVKSNWVWTVNN